MASEASEDVDWDVLGYVTASQYRRQVLEYLTTEGPATPSTIAEELEIGIAHVSNGLKDLRDEELVELLVPEERRKGRIYGPTDAGDRTADEIEQVGGGASS